MSALGINIGALLAQLIVFLIVLWVLSKYAFPVLTKTPDTREARIREGVRLVRPKIERYERTVRTATPILLAAVAELSENWADHRSLWDDLQPADLPQVQIGYPVAFRLQPVADDRFKIFVRIDVEQHGAGRADQPDGPIGDDKAADDSDGRIGPDPAQCRGDRAHGGQRESVGERVSQP